ncbi:zinc metalloproteinase nas-14-like [Anopheles albimanus]|uniref:Metalloendopeptidase n=1 Tax=Anopheles albimanus TaxID=7167 RepID=A0A182FPP3_ANOAL|nr:zinc metalloproteinase nas-14-like [Anopheles albimanus]XP_035784367.1 zinc metalloproteinase nas-14-like [Anopheles albimanus]
MQVLHVAILVILLSLVDKSIGIRYEESGGRHQGDLVLTDLQLDAASSGGTQLVHDAYKWVKGIVPYEIASAFTRAEQEQIVSAMAEISGRSCVRFVERSTGKYPQYLNVTAVPSGCWATLGMNFLSNQMNLERNGCMSQGVIIHQLLHVLGFTHPQSRPDRDFYIRIQQDAMEPQQRQKLDRYKEGTIDDFGIPYDYESILHCPSDAFAASNRATVIPLDNVAIGQRKEMSYKDVRKLNKMYDHEFCGLCVRGNCNEL